MSVDRIKRVNQLLHREIGAAMYHVLKEDNVDLAALTVTHVITSRDLRHARVLVSVRDHRQDRDAILSALKRKRKEFQEYISQTVVLKYTPRLMFELDGSVEKGDNILNILSHLDIPEANPEEDDDGIAWDEEPTLTDDEETP
jgi:ribosome-binding factor A